MLETIVALVGLGICLQIYLIRKALLRLLAEYMDSGRRDEPKKGWMDITKDPKRTVEPRQVPGR